MFEKIAGHTDATVGAGQFSYLVLQDGDRIRFEEHWSCPGVGSSVTVWEGTLNQFTETCRAAIRLSRPDGQCMVVMQAANRITHDNDDVFNGITPMETTIDERAVLPTEFVAALLDRLVPPSL